MDAPSDMTSMPTSHAPRHHRRPPPSPSSSPSSAAACCARHRARIGADAASGAATTLRRSRAQAQRHRGGRGVMQPARDRSRRERRPARDVAPTGEAAAAPAAATDRGHGDGHGDGDVAAPAAAIAVSPPTSHRRSHAASALVPEPRIRDIWVMGDRGTPMLPPITPLPLSQTPMQMFLVLPPSWDQPRAQPARPAGPPTWLHLAPTVTPSPALATHESWVHQAPGPMIMSMPMPMQVVSSAPTAPYAAMPAVTVAPPEPGGQPRASTESPIPVSYASHDPAQRVVSRRNRSSFSGRCVADGCNRVVEDMLILERGSRTPRVCRQHRSAQGFYYAGVHLRWCYRQHMVGRGMLERRIRHATLTRACRCTATGPGRSTRVRKRPCSSRTLASRTLRRRLRRRRPPRPMRSRRRRSIGCAVRLPTWSSSCWIGGGACTSWSAGLCEWALCAPCRLLRPNAARCIGSPGVRPARRGARDGGPRRCGRERDDAAARPLRSAGVSSSSRGGGAGARHDSS